MTEMTENNPKLFISYSWSSPEHQEWVLKLATELTGVGVDVIIDKWNLKEGNDAHVFMEKMVSDKNIKKVAIICDKVYVDKANERSGGVGTETQIISPEIYDKEEQNKFVAIIAEKDENGKPYRPIYYKTRIYIDLSDPDLYATNFEQLLRWIYDKPQYIKPKLGKMPSFLSETDQITLGTTVKYRRAIDAITGNKDYAKGAIEEYFNTFIENLEDFRISENSGEFDDKVIVNIEKFLPFRNEAIEIFLSLALYRDNPETQKQVHHFFERLIPYMYKSENATSYREWDYDNYKFIIHELFLYAIASLLKYEAFNFTTYLIRNDYYVERNEEYGRNVMVPFSIFRKFLESFKYRNQRLNLRRLSVRADLLEQRSKVSGISFRQLMQADFILYIRDCFDALKNEKRQNWWPETLLYAERFNGAFEIFSRSQSKSYFENIKTIFDIKDKNDFELLFLAYKEDKLRIPRWDFDSFDPKILLGYELLAIKP